jgi:inner membrane protein
LQISTVMMQGLVRDRQNLRQEAISGITSKWGAQQQIIGPRLTVPSIKRVQTGNTQKSEVKPGVFLPQSLTISSDQISPTGEYVQKTSFGRMHPLIQTPFKTLSLG